MKIILFILILFSNLDKSIAGDISCLVSAEDSNSFLQLIANKELPPEKGFEFFKYLTKQYGCSNPQMPSVGFLQEASLIERCMNFGRIDLIKLIVKEPSFNFKSVFQDFNLRDKLIAFWLNNTLNEKGNNLRKDLDLFLDQLYSQNLLNLQVNDKGEHLLHILARPEYADFIYSLLFKYSIGMDPLINQLDKNNGHFLHLLFTNFAKNPSYANSLLKLLEYWKNNFLTFEEFDIHQKNSAGLSFLDILVSISKNPHTDFETISKIIDTIFFSDHRFKTNTFSECQKVRDLYLFSRDVKNIERFLKSKSKDKDVKPTPSVIKLEMANNIYQSLKENAMICSRFNEDGCFLRSFQVAGLLKRKFGINSNQIIIRPNINSKTPGAKEYYSLVTKNPRNDKEQLTFGYHVANVVFVQTEDGVIPMVFDISEIDNKPLTKMEWLNHFGLAKINTESNEKLPQIIPFLEQEEIASVFTLPSHTFLLNEKEEIADFDNVKFKNAITPLDQKTEFEQKKALKLFKQFGIEFLLRQPEKD